jgi:hypothetical protein
MLPADLHGQVLCRLVLVVGASLSEREPCVVFGERPSLLVGQHLLYG